MQKNWHTSNTTTGKIVRQMFARPKVALRTIIDPTLRLLVKSYDLNRRTQAEPKAREAIERYIG